MISINKAFDIIQKNIPELETGEIPITTAFNHVLAQDVKATRSAPPFTNSAMDGFAVRWNDVAKVKNGAEISLNIAGESKGGQPFEGVCNACKAIRISTGAMLPKGADTVIPIEDCRVTDDKVQVLSASKNSQHIRFAGEEFKKGEIILKKNTVINAPQIALLASVGVNKVSVFLPPKICVNVTGSELLPHYQSANNFQIYDSNSLMLEAAIKQSGGILTKINQVEDDLQKTIQLIKASIKECRILLFTGGVSVGPHDHVKSAAEAAGFKTLFWQVAQKPGKPLFFAGNGSRLIFGLPGNPVSAFMCYTYYVHPLIQILQGKEFTSHKIYAIQKTAVSNSGIRPQFFQVALEKRDNDYYAHVLARQGSHMITSIAESDGFILLKSGATIKENETIGVQVYPWRF